MVNYAPPSRNPAENDTLTGLLRLVSTKILQQTNDMLPAKVIAYDGTKNIAQVQPLIMLTTTSAQNVQRAQIAAIPVYQASGGGFILKFPISSGDYGWIKANDRDISLFTQTGEQSPPNTYRFHDFADAIFIPQAAFDLVTIASEDANNAVFQNYAGTVKIALWSDLIKILAPNGVGIGGTPAAGLALDVQSTTRAFAPPRMTTSERNAIPSPQEGFTIYNLTTHALETYTNTGWP
ncbi:MAG: hypothetical protein KGL39_23555 [Patescibacteria group bacterium]|nr:hypothetical protein [Patescibacteria group bacterium]